MNILQGMPCNTGNYRKGRTSSIKYIVIHYTANNGDTAKNNCDYYASKAGISASAHYFVDENNILQSVQDTDTAWHCGSETGRYYSNCRNSNSIGIEMCSRKDVNGNYYIKKEVQHNAIELTKYLMKKWNISADRVIRHYDVTHKACPKPFVEHPEQWTNFKNLLIGDDIDMEELNNLKLKIEQLEADIVQLKQGKHNDEFIYGYVDNNMPDWAKDAVTWCYNKGIIKGDTTNGLNLNNMKLWVCVVLYRFAQTIGK